MQDWARLVLHPHRQESQRGRDFKQVFRYDRDFQPWEKESWRRALNEYVQHKVISCAVPVGRDDPLYPEMMRELEYQELCGPPPEVGFEMENAEARREWIRGLNDYIAGRGQPPGAKPPQDDAPAPHNRGVTPTPPSPNTPPTKAASGVTPGRAVPLDVARVHQLAADGLGYRRIAQIVSEETGVPVSFMTIKRRLAAA